MEAPCPLQGSRRPRGTRDLARGLCLGALILALLGPGTASAGAVPGPGLFFSTPELGLTSIPAAELEARAPGLDGATYLIRAAPDEAGDEVTRRGMSVQTALERAGIHSFGYLTIPRPNGTTAYLPANWFLEPASFEGEKPAVFSVDGASTRFIRPLLAGDPTDTNAEDNIATPGGEALVVGVHEGDVVVVQATSSTTSTASGSPVTFTASVGGAASAEERFAFTWSFGDGAGASGETVSHSFSGTGTYAIRVTATGTQGSGGESTPVAVVVGNPPTTPRPGAADTTTESSSPQSEAAGASGKGRQGQGGDESGTSPPRGGGRHSATRSDGSRQSHSDTESPDSAAPRSRTARRSSQAPASTPAAATDETATEAATATPGSTGTETAVTTAEGEPSASAGRLVSGRLVGDDLGSSALEVGPESAASGGGSDATPGAVASGGAEAPVVALIVVGLLAAGALFEWRRWRPLR